MKFAILLLFCCCAVALARPDESKEVTQPAKTSVKHSGEDSKDSGESKESSEESGDKSSNESGKKDGGGAVTGLPLPSTQLIKLLLDRAVEFVAIIFGLHNIHGYVDLIHLIESNPLGNMVWTIVIHPFLQNIIQYQKPIISFLAYLQSRVLHFFPIFQLLAPLELPRAIIEFVFSILNSIAQIFSRPM